MCDNISTLTSQKEPEHQHHHHDAGHATSGQHDDSNIHERRTRWVVYMAAATMVLEIGFGYWTKSMALLTDGYHMASHVFALGLSWMAYVASRKFAQTAGYSFSKKKLLALAGFTSAVVLQVVAVIMAIESFERMLQPQAIRFMEAIIVAVIGLAVNGLSALFLHHRYEHHDHNIRSAYLHVLADGLTSLTAILALTIGMFYNIFSLDSIGGIICSVVITKWAIDLIKSSGKELIDFRVIRKTQPFVPGS
jgi:cation diffusion facilitator family transporter